MVLSVRAGGGGLRVVGTLGCSWMCLLLHDPPPGRGQVLEHGLGMLGEHFAQVTGHGVRPKEVVVQGIVAIIPLARVQVQ